MTDSYEVLSQKYHDLVEISSLRGLSKLQLELDNARKTINMLTRTDQEHRSEMTQLQKIIDDTNIIITTQQNKINELSDIVERHAIKKRKNKERLARLKAKRLEHKKQGKKSPIQINKQPMTYEFYAPCDKIMALEKHNETIVIENESLRNTIKVLENGLKNLHEQNQTMKHDIDKMIKTQQLCGDTASDLNDCIINYQKKSVKVYTQTLKAETKAKLDTVLGNIINYDDINNIIERCIIEYFAPPKRRLNLQTTKSQ